MAEWLKAAVSKTVGGSRPPQVRILSSPPHPVWLIDKGEMSELAEGARLEIVCAAKSGTEGSNPSLSATRKKLKE